MDLPSGFDTRLGQSLEEALPIRVILENGLAPVAAIHDVVKRAWILNSEFASHTDGLPNCAEALKKKSRIAGTDPNGA
jgi:hypothetical protein